MLNCFDVANYFLVLVDRESGDSITQLKLQKLVYFAQGISLALFNKPLFNEPIEAWEHGPVARVLRKTFGAFEKNAIPAPGEIDFDIYSQQEKELIYKVYSVYGEHTAYYLRQLTHEHPIWHEAFSSPTAIITQEKMEGFFKSIIDPNFLLIQQEDKNQIINAEDQWWMNYDSGVPSEDITTKILESIKEQKN